MHPSILFIHNMRPHYAAQLPRTNGIGDHSRGGLWSVAACIGYHGNMAEHMLKPNAREAVQPKEEIGVACDCRYACRRITRPTGSAACWVPVPLVHLHARLSSLRWLDVASALEGWRRISFPVPWSLVRHVTPEEARHPIVALDEFA